jgi:hypothetical protein
MLVLRAVYTVSSSESHTPSGSAFGSPAAATDLRIDAATVHSTPKAVYGAK